MASLGIITESRAFIRAVEFCKQSGLQWLKDVVSELCSVRQQ